MVGFRYRKSRCFTPNCGGKATCSRFSKYLLLEFGLPVGVFLRCDLAGFQLVSLCGPGLEHLGRLGRLLGRRVDRKTRAILSGHDAELVLQLQKEAQEVSGVLYPVLEYDTASKAVFQPGNGKKCFPAKAVFAFLGDEVENYAHTHDGIQIDEFESATRRYPIYECLYNQEKICLCPAPVGSAAAVQVLEYLIAGGVTKIISVGSCGVLEDIPENRFLIPVSALRDEGTSYHYLPPSREVEISKAGINAIESALSQKNIPYWEVKTWTTDGFYRETVEMVQYRKEEGCQVVEMECSALAACAKFRKVTWAMLLFSADTLADPHKYQEREWGKTSISIALELALDAVLSVVEE